jgi:TRAP-type mannitol/chloroaromatic compound transport system permease large subunit
MLPGFFLTALYLIYILGWALINPKIASKLGSDQYRISVPEWVRQLERGRSRRVTGGLFAALFRPSIVRARGAAALGYDVIVTNVLALLVPVALTVATFGTAWWYVVIYNAPEAAATATVTEPQTTAVDQPEAPQELGTAEEKPQELGGENLVAEPSEPVPATDAPPEEMSSFAEPAPAAAVSAPEHFYAWFWGFAALSALLLAFYYWRMDGEQFEILKELTISVVPLGVLTFTVLAVILFGITTATESAAIGALGALFLAVMMKYPRQVGWWSLAGGITGLLLGSDRGDFVTLIVSGCLGAVFAGTVVPWLWGLKTSRDLWQNLKESVFLTAKTTAMVCWLFIGSALFSGVFALHGGQGLIERWVLSMNLSPIGFLFMSQLIIFLLGWPLEWTEIIVIFCPIFIPLLGHFDVDPILFGTMVAVNLQAAFLSPPVAMSAFYLKGVAPKHVTLNQIFAGMMPYMFIVCICLAFMYIWPGMTLWLPAFLYGQ